jgi:hypothetical protein
MKENLSRAYKYPYKNMFIVLQEATFNTAFLKPFFIIHTYLTIFAAYLAGLLHSPYIQGHQTLVTSTC